MISLTWEVVAYVVSYYPRGGRTPCSICPSGSAEQVSKKTDGLVSKPDLSYADYYRVGCHLHHPDQYTLLSTFHFKLWTCYRWQYHIKRFSGHLFNTCTKLPPQAMGILHNGKISRLGARLVLHCVVYALYSVHCLLFQEPGWLRNDVKRASNINGVCG